jgi:hypothetical protein
MIAMEDREDAFRWTCVRRATNAAIVGLFLDLFTGWNLIIGVTAKVDETHGSSLGMLTTVLPTVKRPMDAPMMARGRTFFNIFQTMATLDEVKSLQIRKIDERCIGMLITHHDSSCEVLGQWDPADEASIERIFDVAMDGPLLSVAFDFSRIDNSFRTIANILAVSQDWPLDDDAEDDPDLEIIDCSPTVCFKVHNVQHALSLTIF